MGAAVVNDLDVADGADALEEILQIFFGGVIGQVAEVDPRASDLGLLRGAEGSPPWRALRVFDFTSRGGPSSNLTLSFFSGRAGRTGSL